MDVVVTTKDVLRVQAPVNDTDLPPVNMIAEFDDDIVTLWLQRQDENLWGTIKLPLSFFDAFCEFVIEVKDRIPEPEPEEPEGSLTSGDELLDE